MTLRSGSKRSGLNRRLSFRPSWTPSDDGAKGDEWRRSLHAKSIDWLPSAIVSVANASSLAAHDAVAKITAAAEEALVDRIDRKLSGAFGPKGYDKDAEILGVSGGMRYFDFVVGRRSPAPLFINGVLPHKISIASKYVSFSDTEADKRHKFAVHDRELDNDDTLLLQQVASVVPFLSLAGGAQGCSSRVQHEYRRALVAARRTIALHEDLGDTYGHNAPHFLI